MKICILTPRFPFPQYGGDALRINEIAKYLKKQGHTLVLVSLSDEKETPVEDAEKIYDKVYYVKRNKLTTLINCSLSYLKGKPLQCGYYYSASYKKMLCKVIETEKPDLYISHLLRMTPYLEELGLHDKSIIEMTDALSKTYTLSSKAQGVGLLKYIYAIERQLIKRYEKYVISKFPKVVLVSQADVDFLKSENPKGGNSLYVYTNGVDMVENISPQYDVNKICFVGNMRSIQNQDAALHFAKNIFPLIKERMPNAKFHIVGSLPPPSIKALQSENIIVTGFVDDLYGYISDSCCNVAPVRVAAGIQNKVLVAMGCGLPVIMSSLISKGIPPIKDNGNCFVCDDVKLFAERCIEVMSNPSVRNDIGLKGYQMVKHFFCWDECLKGYENIGV